MTKIALVLQVASLVAYLAYVYVTRRHIRSLQEHIEFLKGHMQIKDAMLQDMTKQRDELAAGKSKRVVNVPVVAKRRPGRPRKA